MTAHRFGTLKEFAPKFPVGTRIVIVLGAKDREVEAVIRGPLEMTSMASLGKRFISRTVRVKVEGEIEERDISPERIVRVVSPPVDTALFSA